MKKVHSRSPSIRQPWRARAHVGRVVGRDRRRSRRRPRTCRGPVGAIERLTVEGDRDLRVATVGGRRSRPAGRGRGPGRSTSLAKAPEREPGRPIGCSLDGTRAAAHEAARMPAASSDDDQHRRGPRDRPGTRPHRHSWLRRACRLRTVRPAVEPIRRAPPRSPSVPAPRRFPVPAAMACESARGEPWSCRSIGRAARRISDMRRQRHPIRGDHWSHRSPRRPARRLHAGASTRFVARPRRRRAAAATSPRPPSTSTDLLADIDIGGRTMHILCVGPIDTGRADRHLRIRPRRRRRASGATSSMSSMDRSVPAPTTAPASARASRATVGRTTEDQVADLRALLAAAKVAPPYLLVGYSLGGWNVMVHADAHPADVVGAVMVDVRPPAASQRVAEGAAARVGDRIRGDQGGPRGEHDLRHRPDAQPRRPPTRRQRRAGARRRRASATSRSSCWPPRIRRRSPRASSPPSPRRLVDDLVGAPGRARHRARPPVAWSRSRTRPTRCPSSAPTRSPTRSRRSSATEASAARGLSRSGWAESGPAPGTLEPSPAARPGGARRSIERGGRTRVGGARQDHPRRGRQRRPPGPRP